MSIPGLALAGVLLTIAGCGPGAGAHERQGDRAYSESRFVDAVTAYRLAVRSGARADLWAKLGSAGLRMPDYAVAAAWYRRAAEQDHAPAQINLGYLYEKGLGVQRNLVQAMLKC